MTTPGRAAIVYHAGAGRGRAPGLVGPVRRTLQRAGWRVTAVAATRRADHARTELAPYLAGRVDFVVVIAGDGTLRELCAGLVEAPKPMPIGFVPAGNANVVARDQAIPLAPRGAIALLTRGVVRRLDVGRLRYGFPEAGEHFFLAMVEIGFGAEVVRRAHRLRTGPHKALYRRWGDPVYAVAALGALLAAAETPFRIRTDDKAAPRSLRAAVIANTRCYAKGWAMAPGARMDDGRLDLVGRGKTGGWVIWRAMLAAARRRRPPAAFSWCRSGRRFVVCAQRPLTVQADGDPAPHGQRLEIDLLPGRLSLITPP